MLAAIEVYNKPRFDYRDECCVILLINSWELVLKALLSKNGESIFYPKRRREPYRTLSCRDALLKAETYFPSSLPALPIRKNLEMLSIYRDNCVHFYNAKGFGVVLYALAQTSIVNFKDLLSAAFRIDLGKEISWQLLPLGLKPPVDALDYMSHGVNNEKKGSTAVRQFLTELANASEEVHAAGLDTGRVMTVFTVKLESTKKIERADFVIGVQKADVAEGPLAIVRTQDPNITHPLKQGEILEEIGNLHGRRFTQHVFQAIAWKHDLKNKPHLCWKSTIYNLVGYSREVVTFFRDISEADLQTALAEYRRFCDERLKRNKLKKTA
jgi:Domain of unknown function (DUF3644)/EC042_2821-like Restriction Endonuclease-like domain